jgi:hypothetical protein
MVNLSFFPYMNVKELKSKNSFDSILSFGFNLECLKMYAYFFR